MERGAKLATSSVFLRLLNVIAYVSTVLVNGLAGSTRIIGGTNTAQISDKYTTLITPAGYVFSIWGIIYVLLGIFVVFQVLPSERGKEYQKRIGFLFLLSSIFNIVWLFLWQYENLLLSVVVMFLLLASLIAIYVNVGIGRSQTTLREILAVHIPFSVYLGWITIASIANVAAALVSVNWKGFGIASETWAILIIVTAQVITLLMLGTRKDMAYGLVVVWALMGIAVKQNEYQSIVVMAEAGSVVILIAGAAAFLFTRRASSSKRPL